MNGFTGCETANSEELPPRSRSWTRSQSSGAPATPSTSADGGAAGRLRAPRRFGDPLYGSCRTLHTGIDLLANEQTARLNALFAADAHAWV